MKDDGGTVAALAAFVITGGSEPFGVVKTVLGPLSGCV